MKPREGVPVSIKDVARALGISHSTVSRALRGSPLVQESTAAEVKRVADEMGYRASAVARSLVTRETRTIGVVVTTIADPFHSDVVSGIEDVASSAGYSILLANSHIDPEREMRVVQSFWERRVDGILVASSRVGELYLSHMSDGRVPIVLINNQHDGGFVYSVHIDDVESARCATQHLIDLGHKQIAYLGDRLGVNSDVQRMAGYRAALAEAGLKFRNELVVRGDGLPEGCFDAMEHLLNLPMRPTAIFCYNDMSALGALHIAVGRGLKIPRDLSMVGFDDLFFAKYLQPPLTTIRQPRRAMGKQAARILLDLLAGKAMPAKQIRMAGELIVRSSSAGPPRKAK